jgi:hypothetical protein
LIRLPLTYLDRSADTKCRCRGWPLCPPARVDVVVINLAWRVYTFGGSPIPAPTQRFRDLSKHQY